MNDKNVSEYAIHNPIETEDVKKLLLRFAIPSIIANLANSLYAVVDQIFIGQGVGYLGNAASNIAFPLVPICLALGLIVGVGAAAHFNLNVGRKNLRAARETLGTAFGYMLLVGLILTLLVRFNVESIARFFGASDQVLPYATDYIKVLAYGFPFLITAIGGTNLIRADGAAKYSMMAVLAGALLNTILDPLFIFGFGWGMAGAAWATILGQMLSGLMVIAYVPKFKSVNFSFKEFSLKIKIIGTMFRLGINSLVLHLSNTVVQIVLNNTLNLYGSQSVYGPDIPIASSGIVIKINTLFIGVLIGIIQGSSPIIGVNYGAEKYGRVRETYRLLMQVLLAFSVVMFLIFQLFPTPLVALFGNGNARYFQYATMYLRVFLFMTLVNGMQVGIASFFASIGKGFKSALVNLLRQLVILVPLILLMGRLYGVQGVPFAAPLSDSISFIVAMTLVVLEFKHMPKEDLEVHREIII